MAPEEEKNKRKIGKTPSVREDADTSPGGPGEAEEEEGDGGGLHFVWVFFMRAWFWVSGFVRTGWLWWFFVLDLCKQFLRLWPEGVRCVL